MDLAQAMKEAKENPGKIYKYIPGTDVYYDEDRSSWLLSSESMEEDAELLDFKCKEKYPETDKSPSLFELLKEGDWVFKKSTESYRQIVFKYAGDSIEMTSKSGWIKFDVDIREIEEDFVKIDDEVSISFLNMGRNPLQGMKGDILISGDKDYELVQKVEYDQIYTSDQADNLVFFKENAVKKQEDLF